VDVKDSDEYGWDVAAEVAQADDADGGGHALVARRQLVLQVGAEMRCVSLRLMIQAINTGAFGRLSKV
jgi:hypothetical protein